MSLALSKSAKRRRCLEEIASFNNHNGNSSSEQHISHKPYNIIRNECVPTPISVASNHNEELI